MSHAVLPEHKSPPHAPKACDLALNAAQQNCQFVWAQSGPANSVGWNLLWHQSSNQMQGSIQRRVTRMDQNTGFEGSTVCSQILFVSEEKAQWSCLSLNTHFHSTFQITLLN